MLFYGFTADTVISSYFWEIMQIKWSKIFFLNYKLNSVYNIIQYSVWRQVQSLIQNDASI